MSADPLLAVLTNALSPDKAQRSEAEAALSEGFRALGTGAMVQRLLAVAAAPGTPAGEAQLAAIVTKRRFMDATPGDGAMFPPAERDAIRAALLGALPAVPVTARKQLVRCVAALLDDEPWPELVPVLVGALSGADAADPSQEHRMVAALDTLYAVVKPLKLVESEVYATPEREAWKDDLSASVLPLLPRFATSGVLLAAKTALKIFEALIACRTPKALKQGQGLMTSWLDFMLAFPSMYQQQGVHGAPGYLTYVRCLKRIGRISTKLLDEATKKAKPPKVSLLFLNSYATAFAQMWIAWLRGFLVLHVEGNRMDAHSKVNVEAMHFLRGALRVESLYRAAVLPCAGELITSLLFTPFIPFNAQDEENMSSDLSAYTRTLLLEEFDGYCERDMATALVKDLVRSTKPFHDASLLPSLLTFLQQVLEQPDSPATDGCLHLLASMKLQLKKMPDVWNGQIERVLNTYVAPRLASALPYLRAKAVCVCGKYVRAPFSSEDVFGGMLGAVMACIDDPEMCVRVAALFSLTQFLGLKRSHPYLAKVLPRFVEEALTLVSEHNNEHIIATLHLLVGRYSAELLPSMERITETLVQYALATRHDLAVAEASANLDAMEATEADTFGKAYDGKALAVERTLTTLGGIAAAVSSEPTVRDRVAPHIYRLVSAILSTTTDGALDMVAEAADLLSPLLCYAKSVPPEGWELLNHIFRLVQGDAAVHFESFAVVIENFACASPSQFVEDPTRLSTLQVIYRTVVSECAAGMATEAPPLVAAILEHFGPVRTQFDWAVPEFLDATLAGLAASDARVAAARAAAAAERRGKGHRRCGGRSCQDHADSSLADADAAIEARLKAKLFTVVLDACHYDAALTVGHLTRTGTLEPFFSAYFAFVEEHKNSREALLPHDRKVAVLGLSAVLRLCISSMTVPLVAATVAAVRFCVARNSEFYQRETQRREGYDPAEWIDPDEDGVDVDEDEDEAGGIRDADVADELEDDEDAEGDEDDELLGAGGDDYTTPLDDINEIAVFMEFIASDAARASPAYAACGFAQASAELAPGAAAAQTFMDLERRLKERYEADFKERAKLAA